MKTQTLIVFGRSPHPGRVKTRLIPKLGADAAAELYRRLLDQALQAGARCRCERRQLWLDGPPSPYIEARAERFGFTLHRQGDGDLGERMGAALGSAAEQGPAVLIGSDCPAYTAAYLDAAFAELQHNAVTIGPAADGGYVLIGLRRHVPELFSGIPWSTSRVFALTQQRLARSATPWSTLPMLHDIDVPEDLAHCPAYPQHAGGVESDESG